jgi:hypothetical protein
MDKLEVVRMILKSVQDKHDRKVTATIDSSGGTLAEIKALKDIINNIFPGVVRAVQYGSADNPDVYDYPKVTIVAEMEKTQHIQLGSWTFDVSGEVAPPKITKEDVISTIAENLKFSKRY